MLVRLDTLTPYKPAVTAAYLLPKQSLEDLDSQHKWKYLDSNDADFCAGVAHSSPADLSVLEWNVDVKPLLNSMKDSVKEQTDFVVQMGCGSVALTWHAGREKEGPEGDMVEVEEERKAMVTVNTGEVRSFYWWEIVWVDTEDVFGGR